MKTLMNLIGTTLFIVLIAAVTLGAFIFGMETQQTENEARKDLSNYEVVISADGVDAEFALDEKDIIEESIYNMIDDISNAIHGEGSF